MYETFVKIKVMVNGMRWIVKKIYGMYFIPFSEQLEAYDLYLGA